MGGKRTKRRKDGRMHTYVGSCHCNANRFEVEAEIEHVRICDCSICAMRGGLMFRVPNESLRLLTPIRLLSTYKWGARTATDYFCPTCGILPFRRPGGPTREETAAGVQRFEGWSINARCLEGFVAGSVPTVQIWGSLLRLESE
jgi:hypothetical protein